VEASSLSYHLCNDCEFKSDYRKCNKCDLAISRNERIKHQRYHNNNKQDGKYTFFFFFFFFFFYIIYIYINNIM